MKAIVRSGSRSGAAARTIGDGVLVLILSVGGYLGALHLTGNFHSVVRRLTLPVSAADDIRHRPLPENVRHQDDHQSARREPRFAVVRR